MQRVLDYIMRRKGWFLMLLLIFMVGGLLGYRVGAAWTIAHSHNTSTPEENITEVTAAEIEVPHTGEAVQAVAANDTADAPQKRPSENVASAYSGGKNTGSTSHQQFGSFPFDFGRDLRPDGATEGAEDDSSRLVIRTVAKGVFGFSVLALALRVLSDRYLR